MATSSMLRSVMIKNTKQCKKLVTVLEKSVAVQRKPVVMQRPVRDLSRDQIQEIFGERR